MRMLLILLLVAALGLGGFLTRPNEAAHEANADKQLSHARGRADITDLIEDKILNADGKNGDKFEDLVVVTRYTRAAGNMVLECLGLYGQFLCSRSERK